MSTAQHYPHPLTPSEAGSIAKRGRKLMRAGKLASKGFALLDCLLWSCRAPSGGITVSYTRLQKLTDSCRQTITKYITVLEKLKLLSRIKRRVRVRWANGGFASRQATNAYVLHSTAPAPDTESTPQTVIQVLEIFLPSAGGDREAQAALERRRTVFYASQAARLRPD